MLNFEYKGISYGKYVEGEIEALNNSEAAHKLKEQKVIITKLVQTKKKKEVKKKEKTSFSFGTGVKAKDILVFCKQFATMLRAGLPVLNTLEMLIGQAIQSAFDKGMALFKADSIKKAMISLYEGAMKTFASIPFPFNIAVVGGALAFGTGIVNKIRGFEKGGRPPVGQPSIVGEKGAELFVPDQAGTVVPNDKLGMNKNVTVNFNINTVDARGFNELLVNSRGVIINLINSAMNEKGRMAVI